MRDGSAWRLLRNDRVGDLYPGRLSFRGRPHRTRPSLHPLQGRGIYSRPPGTRTREPAPSPRRRTRRTGPVRGAATGHEQPDGRFLSRRRSIGFGTVPRGASFGMTDWGGASRRAHGFSPVRRQCDASRRASIHLPPTSPSSFGGGASLSERRGTPPGPGRARSGPRHPRTPRPQAHPPGPRPVDTGALFVYSTGLSRPRRSAPGTVPEAEFSSGTPEPAGNRPAQARASGARKVR